MTVEQLEDLARLTLRELGLRREVENRFGRGAEGRWIVHRVHDGVHAVLDVMAPGGNRWVADVPVPHPKVVSPSGFVDLLVLVREKAIRELKPHEPLTLDEAS